MHDRDDAMLREGAGERSAVGEVADDERAGHEAAVAGRKIVENDWMEAGRQSRPGSHASRYSPRRR